jgi:hypothetical protein
MKRNLVNTLSPFRILLIRRKKLRAHALVSRLPILTAIVCAINAARGNGYE